MKKKLLIIIAIMVVIILSIMYFIDFNRMKRGDEVLFSTWGKEYAPSIKYLENNSNIDNKAPDSSKKVTLKMADDIEVEIELPKGWNYEEIAQDENNNFYKSAFKFYKDTKENNTILYYYYHLFAVCGTGLTTNSIELNNGKKANIGYYWGDNEWDYISFYELNSCMAFLNNGLKVTEANEVLEFVKTINVNSN